jgi:hypothetical protein
MCRLGPEWGKGSPVPSAHSTNQAAWRDRRGRPSTGTRPPGTSSWCPWLGPKGRTSAGLRRRAWGKRLDTDSTNTRSRARSRANRSPCSRRSARSQPVRAVLALERGGWARRSLRGHVRGAGRDSVGPRIPRDRIGTRVVQARLLINLPTTSGEQKSEQRATRVSSRHSVAASQEAVHARGLRFWRLCLPATVRPCRTGCARPDISVVVSTTSSSSALAEMPPDQLLPLRERTLAPAPALRDEFAKYSLSP